MRAPSPVAALRRLAVKTGDAALVAQETMRMMVQGHRTFIGNGIFEDEVVSTLGHRVRGLASNHKSWIEFAPPDALLRVVRFCLKNGVDPDVVHENGTLLSEACRNNNQTLANFLLDCGAKINGPVLADDEQPIVPLHNAVTWSLKNDAVNQFPCFMFLLDRGADPNAKDAFGQNVLFDIVGADRLDLANILIDRGANVLQLDYNGNTLLHDFICNSSNAMSSIIMEWLVEHGVDPIQENNERENAFDLYLTNFSRENGPRLVRKLQEISANHQASLLEKGSDPIAIITRRQGPRL
jgi:ankyrin repeat protein